MWIGSFSNTLGVLWQAYLQQHNLDTNLTFSLSTAVHAVCAVHAMGKR